MSSDRRLELSMAAAAWFGVCVLSPWWLSVATIAVFVPVIVRAAATMIASWLAAALVAAAVAAAATAAVPADLARQARWEAAHGGILCQTPGVGAECATPRMRQLARRLVAARFAPAGTLAVRTAVCLVGRESGFNPGAVSESGDHGLPQANYAAHRNTVDWRRIYDPVYALSVMWRLSRGGRDWTPWNGGRYPCP